MKTFSDLSETIAKIDSLDGIDDEEKLILTNLIVEKFKENKALENEILDLKQQLKQARSEVWS